MGTNLENQACFYFPDASQISAMVGDHSRQMRTHGRRWWISLITNPLNCWAPVPLSQMNMASLENLGQTSGDYLIYWQNLGWSAKSKIPDCLGFSKHMKTRLKQFILLMKYSTGHGHCSTYTRVNCVQYEGFPRKFHAKNSRLNFYTSFYMQTFYTQIWVYFYGDWFCLQKYTQVACISLQQKMWLM